MSITNSSDPIHTGWHSSTARSRPITINIKPPNTISKLQCYIRLHFVLYVFT